MLGTIGKEI